MTIADSIKFPLEVSHGIIKVIFIVRFTGEQVMITKKDIQAVYQTHRILVRSNDFIYLLPHVALQNWISNYTITFPNENIISENYTGIPHGSATLVFCYDGKGLYGSLFGPATKPCVVGSLANQFEMLFIIEFQPAGLYMFTGMEQKELADQIIPFELINSMLNRLISETLYSTCSIHELITSLDRLLLSNLHTAYPCELRLATQQIIETMGNISTKELSGSVHYSERHLNRIFNRYLGINIKSLSRLVRINKTIRLLRNPMNSITFASDYAGFYDLPHFIHEFKSVCGLTPQEYRSNMSDFYSEIAKF